MTRRLLQNLTFSYFLPVLHVGAQRPLQQADVPSLTPVHEANGVAHRLLDAWEEQLKLPRPSLWRVYYHFSSTLLRQSALFQVGFSVFQVAQPTLLRLFLVSLGDDDEVKLYCFAGGLVFCAIGQSVCHHQQFLRTGLLSLNFASARQRYCTDRKSVV